MPIVAYTLHVGAGGIAELTNAHCLGRQFDKPLDELGNAKAALMDRDEKQAGSA